MQSTTQSMQSITDTHFYAQYRSSRLFHWTTLTTTKEGPFGSTHTDNYKVERVPIQYARLDEARTAVTTHIRAIAPHKLTTKTAVVAVGTL